MTSISRSWRFAFSLLLIAGLFALAPLPPAQAQTLPDCPWPTTALVQTTVTYTLTQDCKPTGRLFFGGQDADNPITVTINGGGYTVDASALTDVSPVIFASGFTNFLLNNITIVGGGISYRGALTINTTATISNTTIRNSSSSAVIASGAAGVVTMQNILVENTAGVYRGLQEGPSAISAESNGVMSVHNLVVRNAVGGNSAIGTVRNRDTSKRLTMTGCFTADGVWPQVFVGNVNRTAVTGACTGTIGNNGSTTRQYNNPRPSACGLPLAGFVQVDATYNLRSDCRMTGPLYVPVGVTVTINGRGHSIIASSGGNATAVGAGSIRHWTGEIVTLESPTIGVAGTVTIRDAILDGGNPIYGLLSSTLLVERSTLRNSVAPNILADPAARFNSVLFENNAYDVTNTGSSTSVMRMFFGADVTIRDSIFRNNTGGRSVLWAGLTSDNEDSPSLTLEGCITFENNSSAYVDFTDIVDGATSPDSYVTDNRTGACDATTTIGPPPPSPSSSQEEPPKRSDSNSRDQSAHSSKPRVHTCPALAPEIIVTDLTGATQCQRIEGNGIGIPPVLAAQPVDAVDVWSWVGIGTRVCFQASGLGVVFLDANDAPRSVRVLPAYRLNGTTCVNIDDHGSVVLLKAQPADRPPLIPEEQDDQPARAHASCMVTLRAILNFRRAPGGKVIMWLPAGVKLTAFQQKVNWFEVDYHGQRGWISADYVDTEGNCA